MHTAIYSDDYLGEVYNIYELLCANGFDSMKIDCEGRNLVEAMIYQKQYSDKQIKKFKSSFSRKEKTQILNPNESFTTQISLSDKELSELEKYGRILNLKKYLVSPTIGREKELKNLMITLAQDKKSPIIVGESGVGKTALVEELAFRIKMG